MPMCSVQRGWRKRARALGDTTRTGLAVSVAGVRQRLAWSATVFPAHWLSGRISVAPAGSSGGLREARPPGDLRVEIL
ncbi:unnamed protein product [Boreogadus saida]